MPSVNFSFKDFESNFLSSSAAPRVKLIPQFSPVASGSYIILEDFIEKDLDSNSSATFSNVVPNVYDVEVWTHRKVTALTVLVTNASSSINAADWIVNNYTGSTANGTWRYVPVPANTGSAGQNGQYSLDSTYVYIYSETAGVWLRTPISVW